MSHHDRESHKTMEMLQLKKTVLSFWNQQGFVLAAITLQLVTNAVIFLNVPVARQILSFLFFTLIPGFLITRLLRLERLDFVENLLFSLGFGVAFLMLTGLAINEISQLVGVERPLSLIPLILVFDSMILIMLFLSRNRIVKPAFTTGLCISFKSLLLVSLPILSVLGSLLVNVNGNSAILLVVLALLSGLLALATLSKRLLRSQFYYLIIIIASLSILFQSAFVSNFIQGFDINLDYYVFGATSDTAFWRSSQSFSDPEFGRSYAMLSSTILPSIYSTVLNLDGTTIFKIIIPFIFAFVPLGLYTLWRKEVGKKAALVAAFLFMAENTFFAEMLGLGRQMVAELFLVLLLIVLFDKRMNPISQKIAYAIFSVALVVSHYSIALIFSFLIVCAWLFLYWTKKKPRNLNFAWIIFFFAVMFAWNIYTVSSASFNSIMAFGDYIFGSLGEIFNPASRGSDVMRGLGLASAPSILQWISRIFAYATEFLIVLGFATLIVKRRGRKLNDDYMVLTSLSIVLLGLCLVVPSFASSFNMTRFYHVLLFLLAPLFFVGSSEFVYIIFKRRKEVYVAVLALLILVPYFLFQTGFIYEICKYTSWSPPLSGYRMESRPYVELGYIYTQDVYGALWLSNYSVFTSEIFSDGISIYGVLTSYGAVNRERSLILTNTTEVSPGDTVYLNKLSLVYGIFLSTISLNVTDILPVLNHTNTVYSNGNCEIQLGTA